MENHLLTRQFSSNRPNILMILVDDLGYGDLSSFGAKDLNTPNIDILMQSGIRFDNFYANCPVCSPTRASLMTGQYPDVVGVPGVIRTHPTNSFGYLSPNAVLLPALLKKNGYRTALIGKWHLGLESPNTPNERGFDYFHGFLGDMMDDYYQHLRHGINYMRLNRNIINPQGHATELFSQWAINYLKNHINRNEPFFLYLAYNAPHTPIQPPMEWINKIQKREKGLSQKRIKLVALIEHLDYFIGKVLAALKNTGLEENTLVIFSSDNGGQLNVGANNGELSGGKQNMYEGGIKVPTGVVWKGKIVPGRRSKNIGLTMDIFPTICEVAGINIIHKIDGTSFTGELFTNTAETEEDRVLIWVRREGNQYGGRAYYAIRKGDWKLLQNSPFEPMRLFNLRDDPEENFLIY
jgi:arylsulfatase A-like enzyme